MEALVIYLVKASVITGLFYGAYYFFLRNETFFDANRFFLLAGLGTSALLPLVFITRIVWVEPQLPLSYYPAMDGLANPAGNNDPVNWFLIAAAGYVIIAGGFALKVLINMVSLTRFLTNKSSVRLDSHRLIDSPGNQAPFSFFNFIVINSSLYSENELESILLHEKVHSREKHSLDILTANLFCCIFWFNPLMWLYKKAIVQNLEFIADKKATQHVYNKREYLMALVKTITHTQKSSITNHFYQSLIKKRIVMLNKDQSKRRNSVKYLIVLPLLTGFVFFFQVKVIAQEKQPKAGYVTPVEENVKVKVAQINKNTSAEEMKKEKETFKKDFNTDVKFSKVKRNSGGELTSIKVDVKTKNGKTETYHFSGASPIKPFFIYTSQDKKGKILAGVGNSGTPFSGNTRFILNKENFDFDFNFDFPEIPEIPEVPTIPNVQIPTPPSPPNVQYKTGSTVIKKKEDGKHSLIMINGDTVLDLEELLGQIDLEGFSGSFSFDWNDFHLSDDKQKEALRKAKEQLKQARPDIEKARREMREAQQKMRTEMRVEIEQAREEIRQARIELEKSRKEIQEAREQMRQEGN